MGQANNRGTFEQRQVAAYDRIDAEAIEDAAINKALAQSEQERIAAVSAMISAYINPQNYGSNVR